MLSETRLALFYEISAWVLVIGLFSSRAMMSIGTVMLGLSAILSILAIKSIPKDPLWLLALFLTLYFTASYFYTEESNSQQFYIELGMRWAFLGIFSASLFIKRFAKRIIRILWVATIMAALVSMGTLFNYLFNYEEINELILKSHPIPIINGYGHISFSYLVALTIVTSIGVFIKDNLNWSKHQWLILLNGFNFILLHVIGARTGLMALYVTIGFITLIYMIKRRWYWQGISAIVGLALFIILAVNYITPLQNRYQNTLKDWEVIVKGGNPNWWSGAMRLESFEKGWHLFQDHIWIGVGMADLNDEMQRQYEKEGTLLIPQNRLNPHHQFLNYLISGGIPAGLSLLLLFLIGFWRSKKERQWILASVLILSFVAFNFEALMERQIGTCAFAFFFGLGAQRQKNE